MTAALQIAVICVSFGPTDGSFGISFYHLRLRTRQFSHILGSLLENGADGCVFIGMVGFPMKLDGFVPLLLACASWETFKAPWTFPFSAFFGDLMASNNGLQFESAKFVCICFDMVGVSTLEMIIPLIVHGSAIGGNNFEVTKTTRPTKLF